MKLLTLVNDIIMDFYIKHKMSERSSNLKRFEKNKKIHKSLKEEGVKPINKMKGSDVSLIIGNISSTLLNLMVILDERKQNLCIYLAEGPPSCRRAASRNMRKSDYILQYCQSS